MSVTNDTNREAVELRKIVVNSRGTMSVSIPHYLSKLLNLERGQLVKVSSILDEEHSRLVIEPARLV